MKENRYEIVETFNKFWNLRTKLYTIEGRKLPMPIGSSFIFYFGLLFVIRLLLDKIPIIKKVFELAYLNNVFMTYVAVPTIGAYLLDHIKLDGKLPYIYFLDLLMFAISPKRYEQFRPVVIPKSEKLSLKVKYRIESLTNIMLKCKINYKKYRHAYEYI